MMRTFERDLLQSDPTPAVDVPLSILVVDDSKAQRRMLAMALKKWGYDVSEADSGEEAMDQCQTRSFDMVLSDWMMEGMSGLDFCEALRRARTGAYSYFILLTSKSEKTEIAKGLEAGADDFLTKPVSNDELRARLRAGERILTMQREVLEKNRLLASALGKLRGIHEALDRDLLQARIVQQTFMRERRSAVEGGEISILFRSSGHVGGDLVGWFGLGPSRVVLYSIDVSGHGVASAMTSARLAGVISTAAPNSQSVVRFDTNALPETWAPDVIAHRLNRMMIEDLAVDQYFTMAYAELDLESGEGQLVQAGHPHPMILRSDGTVETIGEGGMPVGLIDSATYDRIDFKLSRGDRLFLMTDGITECPSPEGVELGETGLANILQRHRHLNSRALLDALVWELTSYYGGDDFPDDVSGLAFDYCGLNPPASRPAEP